MKRDEKASIVEELHGKFAEAKIAIVCDYSGLTVTSFETLRRELKKDNAEVRVAKNTLLRRAVEDTAFAGLADSFKGTTAVAVSYDDPVFPAKVLTEFAKDNPQLEIRNASLEGKILSEDEILALSKLPSKEVMLAKLLSVMNAVPSGLVQVLSGVPRKVLYALKAVGEQKGQADN